TSPPGRTVTARSSSAPISMAATAPSTAPPRWTATPTSPRRPRRSLPSRSPLVPGHGSRGYTCTSLYDGRGLNLCVSSMSWSIKLFTVGGNAVRMHLTFLLLVAWIAIMEWRQGTPQDAARGVLFILVLFTCVVLHEFGHIWAARRYGIRTPDVTLLPIGGVASMERMPEKPSQEIAVALAGPAVNAAIAFVLLAVLWLDATPLSFGAFQESFLAQVAAANVVLLIFNLIPAFPMDGGRVLRAVLAIWLGYGPATQ